MNKYKEEKILFMRKDLHPKKRQIIEKENFNELPKSIDKNIMYVKYAK